MDINSGPATRFTDKGIRVMALIHTMGVADFKRLISLVVPEMFRTHSTLHTFVTRRVLRGELTAVYGGQKVKRRFISVRMTEEGERNWINPMRFKAPSTPPVQYPEPEFEDVQYRGPIAVDPDRLPAGMMPCRQSRRICYEAGCYLKTKCEAHPEYEFLINRGSKNERR